MFRKIKVWTNNISVYVAYKYVLKYNYGLKFQIPNSIIIPLNGFDNNIFSFICTSSVTRQCKAHHISLVKIG